MSDFTVQFGRLVAYRGKDTHVIVPDNVTVIGRRSFYFSDVTDVVLPETVTEIEQEAFLFSKLQHIQVGSSIKKIGADAFLCGRDFSDILYPRLAITVFSGSDRRRAFYDFVSNATEKNYEPDVYEKNLAYVRKHLFDEIEYLRKCIDVLEKNPELLSQVIASGKIPAKDFDVLVSKFVTEQKPEITALILQHRR